MKYNNKKTMTIVKIGGFLALLITFPSHQCINLHCTVIFYW